MAGSNTDTDTIGNLGSPDVTTAGLTKVYKESEEVQYSHRGLANRSFERQWTITDDVEIKEVIFEDGLLTINLGKVVPEHHARHDWL